MIWLAVLALLVGSCGPKEPPTPGPEIDSDPVLVAACRHIQGGGAEVKGGDGGSIYRVNRLDDSLDPNTGLPAAGTLRYAVTQSGSRRVLFNVAGTIHLTSELRIRYGNITIDGQSAPGEGICIADYPLVISASNVIVRFLRVRLGDVSNTESDAVSVNNATGVVLDHLSCSWSVDECVSGYGNSDFTMQYCIVSESLKHSKHGKGDHGYGGIWGGANASFHHNLLAHHDSRNPRFDHDYVNAKLAGPIDFVNNVVYNWGTHPAYGGEGSTKGAGGRHINFVNNYFKPGPSTADKAKTRLVEPWTGCENCIVVPGGSVVPPKIYLSGNTMVGSADVTADNWKGSSQTKSVAGTDSRWTEGLTVLTNEQKAEDVYESVLNKAGCSLQRDAVDTRIIQEVRSGGGKIIDTQTEVGGWPELKAGEKIADADYDGIPDEWETTYGLDPANPLDAKESTLVTGHTNLDVYLCYLVRNLYD